MGFDLGHAMLMNDIDRNNRNFTQALYDKDTEISRLKHELAVERAHANGLRAKMRKLSAALMTIVPLHPVLKMTGKKYENGRMQTFADTAYGEAFDATLQELGYTNPSKYRVVAK